MEKFNWENIKADMKKAFKLTDKELETIDTSPIFKIIASIPYLANCEDPDRCAYVNLSTLITAYRLRDSKVVLFRKDDLKSLDKRLQYAFNFIGGNKKSLKKERHYLN